jgi:glycerol-3-phosphate O-acyltransferase / dihydroxyacetone phosphate acyltransferase
MTEPSYFHLKVGRHLDSGNELTVPAGVAIMALGSLAANPNSGLKIVCCGMNYFNAHKFRSRAVVEFGVPIDVPKELVDMYRSGERREATRQLLETIYNGLLSVTVTCPDYDTLMVSLSMITFIISKHVKLIQAVRRLYRPKGKKLPLPMIVELNRRLTKGYERYKDDPRIVDLKKEVLAYNRKLWQLGVRDHQVEYAKFSLPVVFFTFIYRLGKITLLSMGTLPGLILFAPVFIVSKVISIKKSREALAASSVKLQGRDVIATWKLLVSMAFAPLLYTFYSVLLTYWTYRNRIQGYMPDWVSLWMVPAVGYIVFPAITFAALRIGEVGMDILKSLRPLALSLNPTSSNTFVRLRARREQLSADVTELINELGPEMFPDFEHTRLVAGPVKIHAVDESDLPRSPTSHSRSTSDLQPPSSPGRDAPVHGLTAHEQLPRNESFHDLGKMGIFSTRPPSRSHSHSRSNSGIHGNEGLKGLSPMSDKKTLEEVSMKIRGAMRERGVERRRRRSEASWEFASSGAATPSDDGKKDA